MASFSLFRSLHTIRSGPAKPARRVELGPDETEALRAIGYNRAQAWSLERLSLLLEEFAARHAVLRTESIVGLCKERSLSSLPESLRPELEARMAAQPLVRALRLGLDAGREAATQQMTMTWNPDEDG